MRVAKDVDYLVRAGHTPGLFVRKLPAFMTECLVLDCSHCSWRLHLQDRRKDRAKISVTWRCERYQDFYIEKKNSVRYCVDIYNVNFDLCSDNWHKR